MEDIVTVRNNGPEQALVGRQVERIYWGSGAVTFETDQGLVTFEVFGDCCSRSYFHDFIGVEKLLVNGPVVAAEQVRLLPGDPGHPDPAPLQDREAQAVLEALSPPQDSYEDCVRVYGFRFTTEHPVWGEQSSVIAFRNSSNGYYGGWMEVAEKPDILPFMTPITADVLGD
jgi:hypothetical protein